MGENEEKKTEFLGVRVSANVKAALKEIAGADRRSLSFLVNDVLEEYLEFQKSKPIPKRAGRSK